MSNVLITYFSASGVTKSVAEKIADENGYDIFEITPVENYTAADLDYMDKNSRSTIFQLRSLKTFSQAKSPTGNKSAEKNKKSPSSVARTEAAPERHLN